MQEVQTKIGATPAYICGGTPRDRYLGHLENISDIDLTTGDKSVQYLANEFSSKLRQNYQAQLKSMPDGHSTLIIGNLKMDFSSNFNAPGIDEILKKMGINNPTEMQKEMFSRDFTCNALLLSLDLKNVIDPTDRGFKDIQERKIKTCLSPEITLTSNRNRVVRAIYLSSKLGFDIDDSIIQFVLKHPDSIKISTPKSLSDKLNEAFRYDPEKAVANITKMNLWNHIPITEPIYPYYIKRLKGGHK